MWLDIQAGQVVRIDLPGGRFLLVTTKDNGQTDLTIPIDGGQPLEVRLPTSA
jgi:hypothetical protein